MMLRTILFASSLLAATSALAEPRHMIGQRDGVTYDYTADLTTDGRLVFRGVYPDSGDRFELSVSRRGHVDGWVGSSNVSFDVLGAVRDRAVAELGLPGDGLLADGARSRARR